MSTRGRKPKPSALKALAGNPGHRSLSKSEPKPKPVLPPPPLRLTGYARRVWNRTAKRLHEMGVLTEADQDALELYALAAEEYRECVEKLRTQGKVLIGEKGNAYINPVWNIAQANRTAMLRIMTEFGMTPSSRARVRVEKGGEEDDLERELFVAQVSVR